MSQLPENWDSMSHLDKDKYFHRYWIHYSREGESFGLLDTAPDDVRDAWDKFLTEEK